MILRLIFFILCTVFQFLYIVAQPVSVSLNGKWYRGIDRIYSDDEVLVPAVTEPSDSIGKTKIWFKKEITLPGGEWSYATLILKGARFNPEVYINSDIVSHQEGGMATTVHHLSHNAIKPGNKVCIEIALSPLGTIKESNASYIPKADQWRTNISSCIWDDIELRTHNNAFIEAVIPYYDIDKDEISVFCKFRDISVADENYKVKAYLYDGDRLVTSGSSDNLNINLPGDGNLKLWSPDSPHLYNLMIELYSHDKLSDKICLDFGLRDFRVKDKQFYLNGNPCKVRAGSIVWHRWVRDNEGRELAWDTVWFKKNVIQPLKDRGANMLRFHLGNPPERIIDLCDKHGLLVQYEWIFFHGIPASRESLMKQLPNWFYQGLRHPSVAIYHPYNESEDKNELANMWSVLDDITENIPPLVLEGRETIHIHKYWWSLFENLGLYYDSYQQFPKAIMVDEFGGNFLDGNGDMGGYPSLKEAYTKFLGKNHTRDMRLYHHTVSNSRVAEYWRRIGAAGFSPFTILGSWEDGNHWYMGKLTDGKLKPVWNALTAAYSPRSVSIDIWDRTLMPSTEKIVPLHVFNDTGEKCRMKIRLKIQDENGKTYNDTILYKYMGVYSQSVSYINITMPEKCGNYKISAELVNRPANIKYPVVSEWDFLVTKPEVTEKVRNAIVGINPHEAEMASFLEDIGIKTVNMESDETDIILLSEKSWNKLYADSCFKKNIEKSILSGKTVVILDAGPRLLGQGYAKNNTDISLLQKSPYIKNGNVTSLNIMGNINISFREVGEPESHIHINGALDYNFKEKQGWLWNGLRGGIIVPSVDMRYNIIDVTNYKWEVESLVLAGKNLKRSPVLCFRSLDGKGDLVVSQLITNGRLINQYDKGFGYNIRYDVSAVQLVVNLLDYVLD